MKNLDIAYLWPSFAVLFGMAAILAVLNVIVLKKEGM
jgi:hypothetical protein